MTSKSIAMLGWVGLMVGSPIALAGNFSRDNEQATKFGVHEIVLNGDPRRENPFDIFINVTFTADSAKDVPRTVQAFYDGENTWRARVYLSHSGTWRWEVHCQAIPSLNRRTGSFDASDSQLRGRFLIHPKNPRQWITEDGRWFLNLNDTAYFLLSSNDGNGDPVTDEDAVEYVRDDVAHGITSVRCFLTSRREGFTESNDEWLGWFFHDASLENIRLENLQTSDRRLQMLLDRFPDVAVQLILFPLEGYARDNRFWAAMNPSQRDRLLRHLVARYAAFPQLWWLITNDAHYGERFPNSNALVREVGIYLQQHDRWQHPRSTGHARRLPFYFGDEAWVTYVHIEHAHDLSAAQIEGYVDLKKPVFLGEDRYEQDHGPKLDPVAMRYWQRRLFWAWLFSGGSTNYGGRWWTIHPYRQTGMRSTHFYQRPAVQFTSRLTGLDSVLPIRDFFEKRVIDLGEFSPAHELVRDGSIQEKGRTPKLMRRDDHEFLIYHPNALSDEQAAKPDGDRAVQMEIDLRERTGTYSVEWYRADDGLSLHDETVVGGDWRKLISPWKGGDVVLRLIRQ